MAHLWKMLREEVQATVDDFKEKGAVGALRDAVLDAGDLAKDTGGALWNGVKSVVADGGDPVLHVPGGGIPPRGSTAPLVYPSGEIVEVTVLEVDGVSVPVRARVVVPQTGEMILVTVVDPSAVARANDQTEADGAAGSLLDDIRKEWNATVQDFREKGAVGAFKDAALDAVDIVKDAGGTAVGIAKDVGGTAVDVVKDAGGTAVDVVKDAGGIAVHGARSIAAPLLDLDGPPADGRRGGTETGSTTADEAEEPSLMSIEGLKHELRATVQDFREKGAVGAMRDAALDAVDMVGGAANKAKEVAGGFASKLTGDDADMSAFDPFAPKPAPVKAEPDGPLTAPTPGPSSSSSSAPAAPADFAAPAAPAPAAARSTGGYNSAAPAGPVSFGPGGSTTPVVGTTASASASSTDAPASAPAAPAASSAKSSAAAPADAAPTADAPAAQSAPAKAPIKVAPPPPMQAAEPKAGEEGRKPRTSLVQMRRNMFEKKKDTEESID